MGVEKQVKGGVNKTIGSIHNVVKKAIRALGLDPSLSAHDFRHYRATQLLRAGMPLEAVQELLGHVDINTTRTVYAPLLGIRVMTEWPPTAHPPTAMTPAGSSSPARPAPPTGARAGGG
jgi:integrase